MATYSVPLRLPQCTTEKSSGANVMCWGVGVLGQGRAGEQQVPGMLFLNLCLKQGKEGKCFDQNTQRNNRGSQPFFYVSFAFYRSAISLKLFHVS